MRAHAVHAERVEVVDRGAEPDRLGGRRGARLELVGQLVPGRVLALDARDHVAAAEERAHRAQELAPPVQQADRRAERLVAGPGVEVGVDLARGPRASAARPASRRQRHGAGRPRAARDLGHRVDRAEHVRDVRDRHELHAPLGEHRVELVERQLVRVGEREVAQLRAGLLAEDLPRHDVRVVLHLRDEHLVALADVLAAPRVGHEVDRLGGVAREDRAGRVPVHERGDPRAGRLERVGGLARQLVHAAVDRRVRLALEAVHRLDHLLRAAATWPPSRGTPPACRGTRARARGSRRGRRRGACQRRVRMPTSSPPRAPR